jgi:hypothetical protein
MKAEVHLYIQLVIITPVNLMRILTVYPIIMTDNQKLQIWRLESKNKNLKTLILIKYQIIN